MMINRWNTEVLQGYKVSFYTPKGDVKVGIVEKLYQMSGYAWCAKTSVGSCSINDVIKCEPVKRFSIYIQHNDRRNFTGSYLSHNGRSEWGYRTAKKHLKDCVREM